MNKMFQRYTGIFKSMKNFLKSKESIFYITGLIAFILASLSQSFLLSISFSLIIILIILFFFLLVALMTDILAVHWDRCDARGVLLLLLLASFSNTFQGNLLREEGMVTTLSILLVVSGYLIFRDISNQIKLHLSKIEEIKFLGKIFLCAIYIYIFSLITIPFYKITMESINQGESWYVPILAAFIFLVTIEMVRFKKD